MFRVVATSPTSLHLLVHAVDAPEGRVRIECVKRATHDVIECSPVVCLPEGCNHSVCLACAQVLAGAHVRVTAVKLIAVLERVDIDA